MAVIEKLIKFRGIKIYILSDSSAVKQVFTC